MDTGNEFYSQKFLDEIKEKTELSSLIREVSGTKIEESGGHTRCNCPFCQSKGNSMLISDEKKVYECYECGESGDAFSFTMKVKGLSLNQAAEFLAERKHIAIPQRIQLADREKERADTLEINKEAANFYYKNLYTKAGEPGLDYLHEKRQLSDQTIRRFGLGYADGHKDSLYQHLKKKGYTDEQVEKAGLVGFREGRGLDKFRERVVCPVMNAEKEVLGFSGRLLAEIKGAPKYINSPDTLAFDKSRSLYGIHSAAPHLADGAVICEGNFDVISMHQAGFQNTIASMGTAFTENHAAVLRKYTDHAVLVFDNDDAGEKAAARTAPMLREFGFNVTIADLSPYKDPDELLKAENADIMRERISEAGNSYEFEVKHMAKGLDLQTVEGKAEFSKQMQGILLKTSGEEKQGYYHAAEIFLAQEESVMHSSNLKPVSMEKSLEKNDPASSRESGASPVESNRGDVTEKEFPAESDGNGIKEWLLENYDAPDEEECL